MPVAYGGRDDGCSDRPRGGELADRFNGTPKYVVSRRLTDPEWTNTMVLDGDLTESVARLEECHTATSWCTAAGPSGRPIEHDLVDELRLMVVPVILGQGKRLFGENHRPEGAAVGRVEDGRRWCHHCRPPAGR
jgi:dihydrofolate reductase